MPDQMQTHPTASTPATSHSGHNPTSAASTTRLYISPFTPDLYNTFISPALRASANDVSYHGIQTFPEKSYGYLTLPAADAQKLRGKYHNSIFRGTKMRVDEARPERKQRKRKAAAEQAEDDGDASAGAAVGAEGADPVGAEEETGERRSKRSKKARPEEGVLQGVDLPEGRHVKRGWTGESSKDKKAGKRGKSDGDEKGDSRGKLLFKTNTPPNKAADVPETKKSKRRDKDEKANKKGKVTTVKEFEKTTVHPSFLKENEISGKPKQATTFEEGKGWVDGDGNIVESVETRSTRKRKSKDEYASADAKDAVEPSSRKAKDNKKPGINDKEDSNASPEQNQLSIVVSEEPPDRSEPSRERSTSKNHTPIPSTESAGGRPEDTATNQTSTLESLFKRPKPKSSKKGPTTQPTQEPFSFFNTTDDDTDNTNKEDQPSSTTTNTLLPPRPPHKRKTSNNASTRPTPLQIDTSNSPAAQRHRNRAANNAGDSASNRRERSNSATVADRAVTSRETTFTLPPATPFTRRDMETRGLRSAAPTPDTAAIGKRVWPPWRRGSTRGSSGVRDENSMTPADEEEEVEDVGAAGAGAGGEGKESEEGSEEGENEFERKFRAKKGVYAKGWKANRRLAKKEQRQAENRRRGAKGKN